MANDENVSERERRGAIRALGYRRTKEAAGELMKLIVPDRPAATQAAAFDALAVLTGLEENGDDAAAWRRWCWRKSDAKPYLCFAMWTEISPTITRTHRIPKTSRT